MVSDAASEEANNRTYQRLLETFQFVLDVMGCDASGAPDTDVAGLLPGGEAWKSIVRVRMLHGVARARVQEKLKLKGTTTTHDIPISQEDVATT